MLRLLFLAVALEGAAVVISHYVTSPSLHGLLCSSICLAVTLPALSTDGLAEAAHYASIAFAWLHTCQVTLSGEFVLALAAAFRMLHAPAHSDAAALAVVLSASDAQGSLVGSALLASAIHFEAPSLVYGFFSAAATETLALSTCSRSTVAEESRWQAFIANVLGLERARIGEGLVLFRNSIGLDLCVGPSGTPVVLASAPTRRVAQALCYVAFALPATIAVQGDRLALVVLRHRFLVGRRVSDYEWVLLGSRFSRQRQQIESKRDSRPASRFVSRRLTQLFFYVLLEYKN